MMPQNYKTTLRSRSYVNYSVETLEKCLEEIRSGEMIKRNAAAHYNIPRSTIKNKLKGLFTKQPGHQPAMSEATEKAFVSHVIKLSEFGFPVDHRELRFIVKSYLNNRGSSVKEFKDNLPGYDWVTSFIKRHPELTRRFASNIKIARASVTPKVLEEYVENLRNEVKDLPPENIWNFDETNLSDDPGQKKLSVSEA